MVELWRTAESSMMFESMACKSKRAERRRDGASLGSKNETVLWANSPPTRLQPRACSSRPSVLSGDALNLSIHHS